MAQSNLLHEFVSLDNASAVRVFSRELCRSCELYEALTNGVICADCDAKRALVVDALTARFPGARAASEAIALAELLRVTAAELDAVADKSDLYDAATLRRRVHGLVRAVVATLAGQVAL